MGKQRSKAQNSSTNGNYKQGASLVAQHPTGTVVEMSAEQEGPLPPPALLRQYSEIDPRFPTKIIENFELERQHRHKFEMDVLDAHRTRWKDEASEHKRGQLFALIIGLATMGVCASISITGIIYQNKTAIITGGSIGGIGVLGLVTAFLVGRGVKQVMPSQKPATKSSDKSK